MTVKCTNCKNDFKLSQGQMEFVNSKINNGAKTMMLSCSNCGLGFGFEIFDE